MKIKSMSNDKAIEYWTKKASSNPNELSTKVNDYNDFSQLDADFILKYINNNTEMLDLASGSGSLINKIYDKVKHIEAVELFEEFSKFIIKADNINVVNKNVKDYTTNKQFDIITIFGLVQYFNIEEIEELYVKYIKYLKPKGIIIIKNQFGVKEDVIVNGFSTELQTYYYSYYRYLIKEIDLLKKVGFKIIETVDIYPPECNRWDNTHFYAIVAQK